MKQLYGCFNLDTGEYSDNSTDVVTFAADGVSLYICGRIETDGRINDTGAIAGLYKAHGTGITSHISGTYIMIIADKPAKKLVAFHDRTTSPLTLYYTQNSGKLYLSTSLKALIAGSGIKARFNESEIKAFLTNGFLYGAETLVCDVFKLKAFHCLEASEGGVSQCEIAYPLAKMAKGEALEQFKPAMDNAILKSAEGIDDISLPLSAGYDSNYICHVITENSGKNTTAFSIGGKHGKNEVPVVKSNIAHYKNLTLETAITDTNTLKNLPDIVWRLEGNVYENGLFLQYELARLVNAKGKHSLICGECADQVMNLHYLNPDRIHVESSPENPVYYEFSEYPYIFGSYLILKKNGILANSFDIETRYPYLDADVVSVSHALRGLNMKDKRVHVANCNEHLPSQVVNNMTKIGGSTDCHSLFDSAEEIKRFFKQMENSAFYNEYKSIIKACSQTEKEKQTGLIALKTKIRKLIFKALHLKTGDNYFFEEMRLREYLCVAYLALFKELIISGKYDLTQNTCSAGFDKLLK